MNYLFEVPVCECGSKHISRQAQKYSTDNKWTTKKERDKNPNIKLANTCPSIYISDPTWYSCLNCKTDMDANIMENLIEKYFKPTKYYKEEIGIGVINLKGINNARNFK